MAAVYKTVSKKNARQQNQADMEPQDVEMEELLAEADDTTDSEEDEEDEQEQEQTATSAQKQLSSGVMPKTRVLMLTSRGVTSRYVFAFLLLECFI